jgi:sulfite reductase (NADPH) flavoprotein alpha-component
LETTQFDPSTSISVKDETYSLGEALKSVLDITTLSIPFLTRYNAIANNQALAGLLEDEDKSNIQNYINGRDLVDVLIDYPAKELNPQALVDLLRKLPPRLYSIASSQKAHPDSVHLTVAVVRYETHGRKREGVCSSFLADRLDLETAADVFVTPNKNFKLPGNTDAPIIMVGPGTGIAPFRAFMQERKALGAKGKNWLFFGDQHFITDFLYQAEWQAYQKEGLLSKIDLAFSRDQKEKVYVQDKMLANASELYAWLESGAYFYVCGDASRMAHDVDKALHRIVQDQAGISEEAAVEYVKALKAEKRYLRDVY